jgi:PA domain
LVVLLVTSVPFSLGQSHLLRGECEFRVKAQNAFNAGAVAVLIYQNTAPPIFGPPGLASGTLITQQDIPVLGLTDTLGVEFLNTNGLAVHIFVPETPLPAALPLFATGLGALALLCWRRKRKAQAA